MECSNRQRRKILTPSNAFASFLLCSTISSFIDFASCSPAFFPSSVVLLGFLGGDKSSSFSCLILGGDISLSEPLGSFLILGGEISLSAPLGSFLILGGEISLSEPGS